MKKAVLEQQPKRFQKNTLNLNIDSLKTMYDKDDFDFNAPYQRGLVWTVSQKEKLISSIVQWVPINAIYWNEYNEKDPYEIIDGKQRLTTIFEFLEDGFPWRGYYFSELPEIYKSLIKGFTVAVYMTRYTERGNCERLFNRINFSGTPHERKDDGYGK